MQVEIELTARAASAAGRWAESRTWACMDVHISNQLPALQNYGRITRWLHQSLPPVRALRGHAFPSSANYGMNVLGLQTRREGGVWVNLEEGWLPLSGLPLDHDDYRWSEVAREILPFSSV